jgi:hypothetical protein
LARHGRDVFGAEHARELLGIFAELAEPGPKRIEVLAIVVAHPPSPFIEARASRDARLFAHAAPEREPKSIAPECP